MEGLGNAVRDQPYLVGIDPLDFDHLPAVFRGDRDECIGKAADELAIEETPERPALEGPRVLVCDDNWNVSKSSEGGPPHVRPEHVRVNDVDPAAAQAREEWPPRQEVDPRLAPEGEHLDSGFLQLAVEQRLLGPTGRAQHALEARRVEAHGHECGEALRAARYGGLVDQRQDAQTSHPPSFTDAT